MIKEFLNVATADEGRSIAFAVMTDAQGANEMVRVTLDGERFSTLVQGGPGIIQGLIPITERATAPSTTQPYSVVLVAEESGITSQPQVLRLSYKEPGPRPSRG